MTWRYPYPAILDELGEGHAVIEASAGTGKTHTLEHVYLKLLLSGVEPSEILLVTFTEAATQEMRARLRGTLERIAYGSGERAHRSEEGPFWEIGDRERALVRSALASFEGAPISTIHGFCRRALSELAFESGEDVATTLVEPRRIFHRCFRDELRVVLAEEHELRDVLFAVLSNVHEDSLEQALFEWSTERGQRRPIWSEEGFRHALEALLRIPGSRERESLIAAEVPRKDHQQKLHSALSALVKIAKGANDSALPETLVKIDEWRTKELVRGVSTEQWVLSKLVGQLAETKDAVENLLRRSIRPFGVLLQRLLPRIEARADVLKRSRGALDFDDMLLRVHRAVTRGDSGAAIRALRSRYRIALVDEFQDTDRIQWEIFERVFVGEGPPDRRLMVIGDPKQAIYSFRNADVVTYRNAKERLLREGGKLLRLRTSYRSGPALLDRLNDIVEELSSDLDEAEPLMCGVPERRLMFGEQEGPPLCLWHVVGEKEPAPSEARAVIADAIASECIALCEGQTDVVDGDGELRPLRYGDIYVLARTGRELEEVASALRRRGVPFSLSARGGIFETKEARDTKAMLEAIIDPSSPSKRARAWMTPFFDRGLRSLPHAGERAGLLETRLQRWNELARRGDFPALSDALLHQSGLSRRLLFLKDLRALSNFEQVFDVLAEELRGRPHPERLVEHLDALIKGRAVARGDTSVRTLPESDSVTLLTIHRSKGLQADVVFLTGGFTQSRGGSELSPRICNGADDGEREAWLPPLSPDVEERALAHERAEEIRLLYVAITRARVRLYLPYLAPEAPNLDEHSDAEMESRKGTKAPKGPYRYLNAILADGLGGRWVRQGDARFETLAQEWTQSRNANDEEKRLQGGLFDVLEQISPARRRGGRDFRDIRIERGGRTLTSYTRMSQTKSSVSMMSESLSDALWEEELALQVEERDEAKIDSDDQRSVAESLPGGAAMGTFLHALIEDLDYDLLNRDPVAWKEAERTRFRARLRADECGVRHSRIEDALTLVSQAMCAPQAFGLGGAPHVTLPEGFASIAPPRLAEMEFLFSVGEEERYIRGVIDLVFEHQGRVYFVDWKSDRLPRSTDLGEYVSSRYGLQAKLYTVAIARQLRLMTRERYEARFGGLIYAFLRRMPAGQGVVFQRPSFEDYALYEHALLTEDAPFGYRLDKRAGPS